MSAPGETELGHAEGAATLSTARARARVRWLRVLWRRSIIALALAAALSAWIVGAPRLVDGLSVDLLPVLAAAVILPLWGRRIAPRGGPALAIATAAAALGAGLIEVARHVGYAPLVVQVAPWQQELLAWALVLCMVGMLVQRSQIEVHAADLHRLERRDPLTGVANPRGWEEELVRAIDRAREAGSALSVAVLDLDRFDSFNVVRGHAEGDALLKRTALAWRTALRAGDVLARHDGDVFTVLLPNCPMPTAANIVDRLRMAVADEPTASAGVASYEEGETAEQLMERAHGALRTAKVEGRDRTYLADSASQVTVGSISWPNVVADALADRTMLAAYQPIVDLETGAVVAYEALARPRRNEVGMRVDEMFAAAQRMGLGRDLDWLCRQAALAGSAWIPQTIPLFINCSLSGLLDPTRPVDQMVLMVRAANRSPDQVVLEITERELPGDLNRLRWVVSTYRNEGFRIAIDDLGEGHNNLGVMAATVPDFIKIAHHLVEDVSAEGPRAAVRAIVAFAKETRATVIAEGVEDSETIEALRSLEVQQGQGFYFGRPTFPDTPEQRVETARPPRRRRASAPAAQRLTVAPAARRGAKRRQAAR